MYGLKSRVRVASRPLKGEIGKAMRVPSAGPFIFRKHGWAPQNLEISKIRNETLPWLRSSLCMASAYRIQLSGLKNVPLWKMNSGIFANRPTLSCSLKEAWNQIPAAIMRPGRGYSHDPNAPRSWKRPHSMTFNIRIIIGARARPLEPLRNGIPWNFTGHCPNYWVKGVGFIFEWINSYFRGLGALWILLLSEVDPRHTTSQ